MIVRLGIFLRKELREHGVVIALLSAGLAFVWLVVMLATAGKAESMSYFEAHADFVRVFMPLVAVALGHRFVVVEYYGRTQRFLEALPLRPLEPLLVKGLLASGLLVACSLSSLGLSAVIATRYETVDAPFLTVLGLRTVVFDLVLVSFFFTMGLFGKLRIPIYILLGVLLSAIIETTELTFLDTPGVELVGADFAVRRVMPWSAIRNGAVLTVVLVVTGLCFASVREGSVQETLAKRLSARERGIAGVATLAALLIAARLDPEPVPAPYSLEGATVVWSRRAPLVVVYHEDAYAPAAATVRVRLERALDRLQHAMGYPRLPVTRVVLRLSLDGQTFEPVRLAPFDGVLVRANFADALVDMDALVAAVLTEVIDERSGRRSAFEPHRLFRDGLARRIAREDTTLPVDSAAFAALATRTHSVSARTLVNADTERERLGARVAEGLAETCVYALSSRAREQRVSALARALFARRALGDSRETIRALRHPMGTSLEQTTNITIERWADICDEAIRAARERADVRAVLDPLSPAPAATATLVRGEGNARILRVRARIPSHGTEPARVRVSTLVLSPFDEIVEPWVPRVDEVVLAPGEHARTIELPGIASAGTRVFVAVDVEQEVLGYTIPTRVLSQRTVVP